MAKENQDGQQMLQQKQEEIRIAKTETLEQMQEQTQEQGKLSRSLTYSAPSGLQPEDKEEAAEKLRWVFAEKIKEHDTFLQEKRELRSQYEELLNQYRDDSGEQYDDIPFMDQKDRIILTNIKKQLNDMEEQELRWEEEMQKYVTQGPEYERDYLMAQLEWAKQDQKFSEEEAGEAQAQIRQIYQERIQADAEKQEAELKKKQEEAARIQQLEYERKESVEWLSEHGDVGEQEELTKPQQLEFLYHVSRLSEILPLLKEARNEEQAPLQEQAENLLEEKKTQAIGLVRGTLEKEQEMQFPLLENMEEFRNAIQSDSMRERAEAWYQLRLFETGIGEENDGKTKTVVLRSYVETCMYELEQDENREKAKEFLTEAWNLMGKAVSEFQKTNQFISSAMPESIPEEKRKQIAALAASLSREGMEFSRGTIMDKRDLARLESMFSDTDFLKEKKESIRTEQANLYLLTEQSQEQWNTQADPEFFSRIAKKREIKPKEGLRDASVRQKQEYLNHLGQYRQARKELAELAKGKKFKALNGYLAEFDRYTNEEDILYSRVRKRLFERINGEVQKLLNPDKLEDVPTEKMTETLLKCLTGAWEYTEAVHKYGETINLIQSVLDEEETSHLMLPYHGAAVRNARVRAALEAIKKEKTIFSSSDFKRIASRLEAYQLTLADEEASGQAVSAALQAVLDAADSYIIEKLTGKMRDSKTGKPVKEVARISRMVFSDQFSLQDETAKSTGLTEEGFWRLKIALKIRQVIKKTGPENENGGEGKVAPASEEEKLQAFMKDATPPQRELYGFLADLSGLEQLSQEMKQEVPTVFQMEWKKVRETLNRYLDYGKRVSVDSFASYHDFERQLNVWQERSTEYRALDTALSAYEKANPVQPETEETSTQKLVKRIRKAMGKTEQRLSGYFRGMLELMLEGPEKTREMLAARAAEAAAAKQAAKAKQTQTASGVQA